jgi:DUF1009 family protein
MANKLGIVAGGGALPAQLVDACRAQGREVFLLAFEGQTDPDTVAGVAHVWTRLGAAASAVQILKDAGVRELVMAGAVARPSLAELRPDLRTAKWLTRVAARGLGDDGILTAIVRTLEDEDFHVIGVDEILKHLVAQEMTYGRFVPDGQARADIERGVDVARALGLADVGQGVVVQQGIVLAVEAAEGTDALLRRAGELRHDGAGGVLVKIRKPGQEHRADLPTIGTRTVKGAAAAGLSGIAVEAGAALVMGNEAVSAAADAAGLFVVGIKIDT